MNLNIKFMEKVVEKINNEMRDLNRFCVCFTGHRPNKLPWGYDETDKRYLLMRKNTKKIIEKTIKNGYHTFYCGMALGFDMTCAEIVLELREKYPHIKIIGAIPCRDQTAKWKNKAQIDRYNSILAQLDHIRCINDTYVDGCLRERNEYMINNSSLVIALFNGMSGGTKSTIDYAKKQGKKIILINV